MNRIVKKVIIFYQLYFLCIFIFSIGLFGESILRIFIDSNEQKSIFKILDTLTISISTFLVFSLYRYLHLICKYMEKNENISAELKKISKILIGIGVFDFIKLIEKIVFDFKYEKINEEIAKRGDGTLSSIAEKYIEHKGFILEIINILIPRPSGILSILMGFLILTTVFNKSK